MTEAFLDALHADPWTKSLLDLPELNLAVSSLIGERVYALRAAAQGHPEHLRTESLVVLGPPGTGKTHLFARLRKQLGPRAVFVHIRPLLHAGLSANHILGEAVTQLAQPSFGRDEWQVEAMVGSLIGYIEGSGGDFPIAHLSAFRDLPLAERTQKLEDVVEGLLARLPDLDDVFLERLLRIPFAVPRERRALLAWLTGRDCDPSQLSRIGASVSMNPENVVRALRTLTSVAALGAPLVLVFDQLENLIARDAAEERVTQYGNLIAELVDSTRGLLIVQMALDSEWEQGIAPHLNLSQKSRLMMKKVSAELPTRAQSRALLQLWHDGLDSPEHPFPWPLSAEQVDRVSSLPGLTPRMLLSAFKESLEGTPPSILEDEVRPVATGEGDGALEELTRVLEEEWRARLGAAHEHIDAAEDHRAGVDADRLCDGILVAAEFVSGAGLRGHNDPYIQMLPREPGGGGRWVCLLHQGHHRSIGAALERVLAREAELPGVLVREQRRPLLPTWKATSQLLAEAIARPRVVWHELTREETASLLALEELVQTARSRDICDARGRPISERDVFHFLREQIHPENWPLAAKLTGAKLTGAELTGAELDAGRAESSSRETNRMTLPSGDGELRIELAAVLRRLRVASLDRVIREVSRGREGAGRAVVLDGLRRMDDQVQWFGRNLVAWGDES